VSGSGCNSPGRLGVTGDSFRYRSQGDSVLLFKTGTPFNLITGSDAPNVVDPSVLGRTISHPDLSRSQLPRAASAFIRPGEERGNLGRHRTLDRNRTLSLRVESINLSNTPQFAEPGATLTDPNFVVNTNTLNDGRTLRATFRLGF
jgi:hypothetical protein